LHKEEIALNTTLANYYSIKAHEAKSISITCIAISLYFPTKLLFISRSFLINKTCKLKKQDRYAPSLCNGKMVLQKQGQNSMQTKKLIGLVAMGPTQAYGVFHYLDNSLLDDYSFPVKKLHHRTISHLFARVDDIRGHKDNMCAAKKTSNEIWCKVYREYIKLPTLKNIKRLKNNHLETQINAQNNRRQNMSIKIAAS
jgi:hypothetical protein